jgi:bacillithiol system protein YtxJ
MNWQKITSTQDLKEINQKSENQKVMIFKHSTRCSISASVLARMERNWKDEQAKGVIPYYLDLISYRELSNQIAENYGIIHESPQVLIIENSKCIYDASHYDISFEEVINVSV